MLFAFLGFCCAAVSFTAAAFFWLLRGYFRDPEVQRRQEVKFVRGEWEG